MDANNRDFSVTLGKECGQYNTDHDDYVAPGELTVEITLHEYRELLMAVSKNEKLEAVREKIKAEERIKELEEKVNQLTAKLVESIKA